MKEEKGFFVNILSRVQELLAKMISINFVIFAVGTAMFYLDKLPWYGWMALGVSVMGYRYMKWWSALGANGAK